MTTMPDPFFLVLGFIAILCVILFPIRLWQRSRHRYGSDDGADAGEVPLAPPERRNRG
jgi:hypothetical protein